MSAQELFSHRVRAEAAAGITGKKRCDACLGGMILFCREISPGGILLRTESKTVRDLFVRLCEHAAGEGSVSVSKRERTSRPPLYSIRIKDPEAVSRILERAGVSLSGERSLSSAGEISDKNLGAFAAGIFLSCGSVVDPTKDYHLEFVVPTDRLCTELYSLFSGRIGADGGITTRRNSFVLYFKESEHIEDILTLIGAQRSSLELMNVKIYKDIRNRVNRATNCDTANLGRQNRSSREQIDAINKLRSSAGGLSRLPEELKELCELRLKYPEMSLSELSAMTDPPLTRSGVNHRFARIIKLSKETE